MAEELIRAACEAANCKYPDMEAMANFKREVTPSVVIGLIDGLRHAKGMAAINDARANGAAETIQHLRDDIAELRAPLPSQGGEAVEVVAYRYTSSQRLGGKWHYQESFPKWDDRKVSELGQMGELMTVAQHNRIMSDVRASRDAGLKVMQARKLLPKCEPSPDAELVELLQDASQWFADRDIDINLARDIDAKMASLK